MNKIFILILFPFFLQAQTPDTVDVDIILDLSGVTTDGFWKQFHTNEIYYNYPVSILKDTNSLTDADLYINDVNEDFATKLILQNIHSGNDRNSSIEIIPNSSNILQLKSFGNNSASSVFGVPLSNWNYILGEGQGLAINTTGSTSKLKLGANGNERITIEGDGDLIFPHLKTGTLDSILAINSGNEAIRLKLNPSDFIVDGSTVYTKKIQGQGYYVPGTYSYIKPAGIEALYILVIGGGGSGATGACNTKTNGNYAHGGQGGGSGGRSELYYKVSYTVADTFTVVVGAGGNQSTNSGMSMPSNGNNGNDGQASYFEDILRAEGGKGGKGGVRTASMDVTGFGTGGKGLFDGLTASTPVINTSWTYVNQYSYASAAGGSGCGVYFDAVHFTLGQGQDATYIGAYQKTNAITTGSKGAVDFTATTATSSDAFTIYNNSQGGGGGGSPCISCGNTSVRNGAFGSLSLGSEYGQGGGGGGGFIPNTGSSCTPGIGGKGADGFVLILEIY